MSSVTGHRFQTLVSFCKNPRHPRSSAVETELSVESQNGSRVFNGSKQSEQSILGVGIWQLEDGETEKSSFQPLRPLGLPAGYPHKFLTSHTYFDSKLACSLLSRL